MSRRTNDAYGMVCSLNAIFSNLLYPIDISSGFSLLDVYRVGGCADRNDHSTYCYSPTYGTQGNASVTYSPAARDGAGVAVMGQFLWIYGISSTLIVFLFLSRCLLIGGATMSDFDLFLGTAASEVRADLYAISNLPFHSSVKCIVSR
jgi:hypothetical protein